MTMHAPFMFDARLLDVIDGDTLDMQLDLGFGIYHDQRLRLQAVDTAEIHFVAHDSDEYRQGMEHKAFVEDWLSAAADGDEWPFVVLTREFSRGDYGRALAYVFRKTDDAELNDALRNEFGDAVARDRD